MKIGLFFSGILCILLTAILKILEKKFHLTFFLFNMTSKGYESIFLFSAIILFGILIIDTFSSLKKRSKNPYMIFTIASTFSGIVLSFFALVILIYGFILGPSYFVFHSPDKQHTIVVEEEAFLLAGFGDIYEKVNAVFMRHKNDYLTDDGYRPFSEKNYRLDWKQNSLTIKYGFDSDSVLRNEIVIDFAQEVKGNR